MSWEYRIATYEGETKRLVESYRSYDPEKWAAWLDGHGREGWELVGYTEHAAGIRHVLKRKRPAQITDEIDWGAARRLLNEVGTPDGAFASPGDFVGPEGGE